MKDGKIIFVASSIFSIAFVFNLALGNYAAAAPSLGAAIGWFAYGVELLKNKGE